jgi:hypothetical protein
MAWTWAQVASVLFFLWFGLSAFLPALKSDMFNKIGAVFAILIAVFTLLRM